MGVTLSAGNSFRWFRDALSPLEAQVERISGIDAYTLLTEEAQMAPAGSEGLIFLPYLTGERTPHRDAAARGVLFGVSQRHSRAHVVRAVVEGITYAMNDSLQIIRGLGVGVEEIRATGGGARSAFWRQVQADVYDVPVVTVNATEGPAFGAALMAGVGAGVFSDLSDATDQFVVVISTTKPNPRSVARYREGYTLFQSLYPELKTSFARAQAMVERQAREAE
jgi:xylulokinase